MKEIVNYKNTDEYEDIVGECRAAISQRVKNSRYELIVGYAEVGEKIVESQLYKKFGKGNQQFLLDLFEDIGIGKSNGYYAIDFYITYFTEKGKPKFKDVSTGVETIMSQEFIEEGDNLSWNKIKQLYLTEQKTEKIELPKGKYQVIYMDIPWKYDVDLSQGATRNPENNYSVMDLEEIKKFGSKVKELAAKDCVLFMWITAPKLNWMNDVLEACGFEYKTNLIWNKIKPNLGHYSSVRHEILVIAGKGNCSPTCDGKTIQSIDSVQSIEKSAKHSEKPKEFYKIIEKLYPKHKKIELFARGKAREGWNVWGNECYGNEN